MRILIGSATDKGNTKEVNQDSCLAKVERYDNHDVGFFVICDGMGGYSEGGIASGMAIELLREWFCNKLKSIVNESNHIILSSLIHSIENINKEIINYSISKKENVGTTIAALLIIDKYYYLINVGDSRIYKISSSIVQLSLDHTYIAERVRRKEVTLEEAKRDPRRSILTQCLGIKSRIEIYKEVGKIKGKEKFLLCSDGLYNKLSEKEIFEEVMKEKYFSSETLHKCCKRFLDTVKQRNERDNISVILVELIDENHSFFSKIKNLFN